MSEQYYIEDRFNKEKKLKQFLSELPYFVTEYFRGVHLLSINTRISYFYNIRTFLRYVSKIMIVNIEDITMEQIGQVTSTQIEEYLEYLEHYTSENGKIYENSLKGKKRNTDCIFGFYEYFVKKKLISENPFWNIKRFNKVPKQDIIYLNQKEMHIFLNGIKSKPDVENVSKWYLASHEKNKYRDNAIITLFLGTGIRVSELSGLDLDDIDHEDLVIHITRKGGDRAEIPFGGNVHKALIDYLNMDRCHRLIPTSERALFISKFKRRLSVRSVQQIVEQKSKLILKDKFKYSNKDHISPHKLRSSFATLLYEETGDITIVAEMLGHDDIRTTKDHYARVGKKRKKLASEIMDKLVSIDTNNQN